MSVQQIGIRSGMVATEFHKSGIATKRIQKRIDDRGYQVHFNVIDWKQAYAHACMVLDWSIYHGLYLPIYLLTSYTE